MIPPAVADAIDLSRVRRALVIKLRHHGDVLLASPVFTVLKRAAPHAEIDALVYRETAPMLERHPAIARRAHDRPRASRTAASLAQARGELAAVARAARAALRPRRPSHRAPARRLAHAARRRALRRRAASARAPAGSGAAASRIATCCRASTPRHTVEAESRRAAPHRHLAGRCATRRWCSCPAPTPRRASRRCSRRTASRAAASCVIHPGSRWLFKCWPAAPTAALLDRLAASGWPLVLTGAPDPAEAPLVNAIKAALARADRRPHRAADAAGAGGADRAPRAFSSAATRRRCTSRPRWARRSSPGSDRATSRVGAVARAAPRRHVDRASVPPLRQQRLRRQQQFRLPADAAARRASRAAVDELLAETGDRRAR